MNRRDFLRQTAGAGALGLLPRIGQEKLKERPASLPHTLTLIEGNPRERGRAYGRKFKDGIHSFLDREIYAAFTKKLAREECLRFSDRCFKEIKSYAPIVAEEMEGIAEGSDLRLEELVLLNLHEDLGNVGALPKIEKCTGLAAAPPDTKDGNTYVGQSWDWMVSCYGLSEMLHWKRSEGPSVLSYAYPGLWVSTGMNSKGLALCWTWGDGLGHTVPNVGVPGYSFVTHLLYQESLEAAIEEARRVKHVGWFVIFMGDAKGNFAVFEANPKQLVIDQPRGHFARASYGTGKILGTDGKPGKMAVPGVRMAELLDQSKGKLDETSLKALFSDHQGRICKHWDSIDLMLYNCTKREAHIARGPGCMAEWKTFRFE